MTYLYGVCALVGGVVLVFQFVMAVLGLGGDHGGDMGGHGGALDHGGHAGDAHHGGADGHEVAGHASTDWLFKVISFRTLVAALAFFGMAGLAGQESQLQPVPTFGLAIAIGFGAMYGVYGLLRSMQKFDSDGTVRVARTLGLPATVYIRIPGHRSGVGKVHVMVQNRTLEIAARTAGEPLPTGAKVIVNDVIDGETVEVQAEPTGVSA